MRVFRIVSLLLAQFAMYQLFTAKADSSAWDNKAKVTYAATAVAILSATEQPHGIAALPGQKGVQQHGAEQQGKRSTAGTEPKPDAKRLIQLPQTGGKVPLIMMAVLFLLVVNFVLRRIRRVHMF